MANLTVKYNKETLKRIKKGIKNKQFTSSVKNFRAVKTDLNLCGIIPVNA